MPPAVRGRRRDAEGGRGTLQRHPLLDRLDQGETASQSELGVSVQIHPRPPSSVGPGRPTASKEGRTTYLSRSQPAWAGYLAAATPDRRRCLERRLETADE